MKLSITQRTAACARAGTLACLLAILVAGPSAFGMTIVLTYDASVLASPNAALIQSATAYAAQQMQLAYADPITININVVDRAGTNVLANSTTSLTGPFTYAQVRTALIADAKSATDTSATASLGATDPTSGSYWMPQAQAKAIGLFPANNAATDGTFTFGDGYAYTFDPNNRAVAGQYDFIALAEREISEIMGRYALLGVQFGAKAGYTPYDLFRYTAPGLRRMTAGGTNPAFSIDGGVTRPKVFNSTAGADLQDWAAGTNDAFNAIYSTGVLNDFSAVDQTVMDAIGYDPAPVPEPVTLALLGAGAVGLVIWPRRSR